MKWHHQFQFAGYYAAKELSFYKEVGLDVTIKPASNDENPMSNVLSGGAQFGVGSNDLLLLRQRGEPVVALAVIFQHSPYVLLALKKKNIESVQDLVGKRIMFDPFAREIIAYLRAVGISMDSIVKVSSNDYDAKDFLSAKIDAYAGYSTNDPYYLDKAGVPYLSFAPRSAGIDFYGDNLFTTEAELARNNLGVLKNVGIVPNDQYSAAELAYIAHHEGAPVRAAAIVNNTVQDNQTYQDLFFNNVPFYDHGTQHGEAYYIINHEGFGQAYRAWFLDYMHQRIPH